MPPSTQKANILLLGAGGVGTIAALNIESGGLGTVTAVLRSNYTVVTEKGYTIDSVDHGKLTGWRPSRVVNTVPDVSKGGLQPYEYIITTTKNCPDIGPPLPSLIAPAVTPGYTVIVMVQNGLNIEKTMFEAFPSNIVLSGVSMIDSFESPLGTIIQESPDRLYLGAFANPTFTEDKRQAEIDAAKQFITIYGASGQPDIIYEENVPWSRWRKLVYNGVLNPLCAISGMDSSRIRLANGGSAVEGLVRPAMGEVVAVAKALGHDLPGDIVESMLELDPLDLYLKPSMLGDWEKVCS
ncbi:2-dehydropantoate 2-reductase [Aspergillus karnatakaensis]|uniref:ketopantoate reductase family protein n=1 Tax=Aspergillus karnatakaensis TaxID=1810916 RepID=UPI003CCE1467